MFISEAVTARYLPQLRVYEMRMHAIDYYNTVVSADNKDIHCE